MPVLVQYSAEAVTATYLKMPGLGRFEWVRNSPQRCGGGE